MRKLVGFQVLLACFLPTLLLLTSGTASGAMMLSVEYLVVVVGGGAGGYRSSVTGDAFFGGKSVLELPLALSPGTYPVVVGGGGAGGIVFGVGSPAAPMNGSPSSFAGIVSLGGGRGSSEGDNSATEASTGGSGGGGRNAPNGGAAGTSGQGFKGGDGIGNSRFGRGGGV